MRLLSDSRKSDLPLPAHSKDKRGRRLLTARNALSPLQRAASKLRKPSIWGAILASIFIIWVILRIEHSRASNTFAALRTPPPKPVRPARRTPSSKVRKVDQALLSYDGLGGVYLGHDPAKEQPEPHYYEPLTVDGELAQKYHRGIYGGSSIGWSSGVPGVGTYLGPLSYKTGIPFTKAATTEAAVLDPNRTPLEVAIDGLVRRSPVVVFSKTTCPYSKRAKELLKKLDLIPMPFVVEVDKRPDAAEIKATLGRMVSHSTFPTIFIGGQMIGGADELEDLQTADKKGAKLMRMLNQFGAFVTDFDDE